MSETKHPKKVSDAGKTLSKSKSSKVKKGASKVLNDHKNKEHAGTQKPSKK